MVQLPLEAGRLAASVSFPCFIYFQQRGLNAPSRVNNFSRDVSDGENYTILLNQLVPEKCSRAPLQTRDTRQRAEQV